MRILTHNINTGYDFEMAKTGHDFQVLKTALSWNAGIRPVPANWHFIESPGDGRYDVILVNYFNWELVDRFRDLDAPMIFNIIADCSEGVIPDRVEGRVTMVTFLAEEVASRWAVKDPSKKRVIEMGVDPSPFREHVGDVEGVLTVGTAIAKRWDKGHCPFVTVARFMPLTLVGPDNGDIKGAVGMIPEDGLRGMYACYRVYFNPGPVIGISVAEAMMAGMPVVSFRPINLCGLIKDGVNGFVVDTVDGAMMRLKELLHDPARAKKMGAAAQKTARERFDIGKFVGRWNALFSETAAGHKAAVSSESGHGG